MSNLCVEGDEHMFRIAICDDERQFRKRIHDILIEYMNENDILYEIADFSYFLRSFHSIQFIHIYIQKNNIILC